MNKRHNPFPVQSPYEGIYAHGVETPFPGKQLHVSGQIGIDSSGNLAKTFNAQCRQAIQNVISVLASAQMSILDLVQMRFYLVNRAHFPALTEVREAMLSGVEPAVTTYLVAGLVKEEWLIEVEALAFKPGYFFPSPLTPVNARSVF